VQPDEETIEALEKMKEGDRIVHLAGPSGEVWFINLVASPGDAMLGVRLDKEGRRTWRHDLWRIPIDQAEIVWVDGAWLINVEQLED
jgi:hypothetical protein